MKNDRPKKLECLTRKILDGKVVPFLGAGISNDTEVPGCTFNPSAKALTKSLAESLKSLLGSQLPHFVRNMLPGDGNKSGLDERLVNAGLSRIAELHVQVAGEKETYEAMNIMAMDELVPSPAHFYIAYITLEVCIEEIITTNYDCCLEKALLWANCERKTPLTVRELYEYQCGGVPFCRYDSQTLHQFTEKEPDEKRLNVRIYKINGCIQKYIQACDSELNNKGVIGHTLILTEAQLQNWRYDWAREMFRDRLRTRTILFSSFGSEEPQIRHTMLEVLREFEQESNRVTNKYFQSDISNRPPINMPYIAEYDALSFPQHQIGKAPPGYR
ncbi:MAG: SIR2 family protein [Bacillota bacterium]